MLSCVPFQNGVKKKVYFSIVVFRKRSMLRGQSRLICDSPFVELFYSTIFEYGDLNDPNYFKKKIISHGDAVYITTSDVPLFLDVFMALPETTRSWTCWNSIYGNDCSHGELNVLGLYWLPVQKISAHHLSYFILTETISS
jgi:hypothetical protein